MAQYQSGLRIVLRDRALNQTADINNAMQPQWAFVLPGGCDTATFQIPLAYDNASIIGYEYRVEFWWQGVKVWSGFVDSFEPDLDQQDRINVNCVGYQMALQQKLIKSQVYTYTDSGTMMVNLLATYMTGTAAPSPLSEITTGAINTTGYSAILWRCDSKTIADAVNELSILGQAGDSTPYYWGVDENKQFTYGPPTLVANRWAIVKREVVSVKTTRGPVSAVKNNLFVTGTIDGTGSFASGTFSDLTSIATFGQKDGLLQLTGYNSAADMTRAASAILKRMSVPQDRHRVVLQDNSGNIDVTQIRYGDFMEIRGFSDGSTIDARVMHSQFMLDDNGLKCELQLNANDPDWSDIFMAKTVAEIAATEAQYKRTLNSAFPLVGFPLAPGKQVFYHPV